MIKQIFLLSLFLLSIAFAAGTPLKKLAVASKKTPYELELITKHISASKLNKEQIERVLASTSLINKDLQKVDKYNLMFLIKSEIYKGIFNNQYLKKDNRLQISSTVISSTNHKLKKHSIIYSDFSKWIIKAVLSDLAPYEAGNFINRYQNISRSNAKELLKAKKLLKVLNYISPWLNAFNNLQPEQFNQLGTDLSIDLLEQISKKSYYFLTFASQFEKVQNELIFFIPDYNFNAPPSDLDHLQEEEDNQSLKEQAAVRKQEAKKSIESIQVDDLSGLSNEIDKLPVEN